MPRKSILTETSAPIATYRGGFSLGLRYASPYFGLVRLEIFPSGLRVRPVTRLLSPLVPTWEAKFGNIAAASRHGTGLMRGIRFRADDRSMITFVPIHMNHVIAALSDAGVKVQP